MNALQHTRSMLGMHIDVGQHGLRPSGPAGTIENSNPFPHLDDFGTLHTTGEVKQNGAFVGFLVRSLRHCGHPVQPRASLSVPMVEPVAHPMGGGVQASSGQESKLCTHWKVAQQGASPPFPGGVTFNTVPVRGGGRHGGGKVKVDSIADLNRLHVHVRVDRNLCMVGV